MPTDDERRAAFDKAMDRLLIKIACRHEANPELAKYRNGRIVDWEGGDQSGFELPEAHLLNAKLSRANFTDAVLDRANLRGADLSNAKLIRTSLVGADLTGANLDGADLTDANLDGAIGLPAAATA